MYCGNKRTLSWDVIIFTSSWHVSMTGFTEKNKYDDDDTVHTGIKHANI